MSKPVMIRFNYYPGGKRKCVTLSYDDGVNDDRRLVEIMNAHGLKGSFHLNSANLHNGGDRHVQAHEAAGVYAGHEISLHSYTHPDLREVPRETLIAEIWEDRKSLEAIAGYPVRGMSYPFGTYNESVMATLRTLGVACCRTVKSHNTFMMPEDWLQWHPTCHHRNDLAATTARFLESKQQWRMDLLYVWGHSYEFPAQDNWHIIEEFAAQVGGREDIWYATNIEIYDYMTALHRLEFSAGNTLVRNPSAMPVWIHSPKGALEVPAGAMLATV